MASKEEEKKFNKEPKEPSDKEKKKQDEAAFSNKKICDHIKELYEEHPGKKNMSMRWAYNKAFFEGNHYLGYDPINNQINCLPSKKGRHQCKINQVRKNGELSVNKIMKNSPFPQGVPMGEDDDDRKAAKSASKLLEHYWRSIRLGIQEYQYSAKLWSFIYGSAWLRPYWNESIKDVSLKVYDPFNAFPDPCSTNYFDMRWFLIATLEDKDLIKEMYGDNKDLPLEAFKAFDAANSEQTDKYRFTHGDYHKDLGESNKTVYDNKVLVFEYWERPSKEHSGGRCMVVLNEKYLAKNTANPFAKNKEKRKLYGEFNIPFIPDYWNKMGDSIYGYTPIEDMIPLNKDLNILASHSMENVKHTASNKWLIPKSSGLKGKKFDDLPGEFIPYNDLTGGEPHPLYGQPLPGGVAELRGFFVGTIMDISGNHEVSMGQLPQGGSQMSGTALAQINESEFLRQTSVMYNTSRTTRMLAMFLLLLAKDYYTKDKMITIAGKYNQYEVEAFTKADLAGNFDILLEVGSLIDISANVKQEVMAGAWDRQVPQMAEQGSKAAMQYMMAMGIPGSSVNDFAVVEKMARYKAQWIIDKILLESEVPPVLDFENHQIILEEFQKKIAEKGFYDELSPAVQEHFMQRYYEHQRYANQQMQQIQQQQQAQQQ